MKLEDVKGINDLFVEVYPYVVDQIMEEYKRDEGMVLELGPFSSGITLELARRYPKLRFIIGAPPRFFEYLRSVVEAASLGGRAWVRGLSMHHLPFPDGTFDLAIFRGGLFFWERTMEMLREMYRVLRPGGLGMAGGGFGKDAPEELIYRILPASRKLNERLGKRSSSRQDLEGLIRSAGLDDVAVVEDIYGLWIYLRKPGKRVV